MKRHLLTLLRLSIAFAGVGFIIWSLTWTDRLVLPPEHALIEEAVEAPLDASDWDASDWPADRPVVARVVDWPEQSGDGRWHVRLPAELGGEVVRVATEAVGPEAGDVRYEPGVGSTLAEARWAWLAAGLLLMAIQPAGQAFRWWLLMRCRGLDPGYLKSLRLTMVGLFFNFSLPGMTGGDLVKAYYAAKGSGAGSTAVISVVFDRMTGMTGLIVLTGLAATAGVILLDEPMLVRLTGVVWVALAALLLGAHVYLSRRVRRQVAARISGGAITTWLSRLTAGLLAKVDQAAAAYREHIPTIYLAVGLSVIMQVPQMIAVAWAGQALGMGVPLLVLLAVLPVVFFIGTLPISYQGLGVMEALALALLLSPPEATANQVVGMLLLARLYLIFYALLGAGGLLRGDMRMFPHGADGLLDQNEDGAELARHDSEPARV